MKKILSIVIAITLVLSSVSVAYAKQNGSNDQKGNKHVTEQQDKSNKQDKKEVKKEQKEKSNKGKAYGKKQSFKFEGSPVIKYGKYKLPIRPITKGMGATYTFDKTTGILNVTKDITVIVINFKDKKVTVNGVADTSAAIFSKSDKNGKQMLKYIADKLGVRITFSKDKVTTEAPITDDATAVSGGAISVSGSALTVTK